LLAVRARNFAGCLVAIPECGESLAIPGGWILPVGVPPVDRLRHSPLVQLPLLPVVIVRDQSGNRQHNAVWLDTNHRMAETHLGLVHPFVLIPMSVR